jgi:hypothetical protein
MSVTSMADAPIKIDMVKARDAFTTHRRNATKLRGVGWELTFEEWLSVWIESGRWAQRGRGLDFYCMCRNGDVGPYKIGNVFIGRFSENSQTTKKKKSDLPIGVHRTRSGGYRAYRLKNGVRRRLGTFKTPELASAAYQNCGGSQ